MAQEEYATAYEFEYRRLRASVPACLPTKKRLLAPRQARFEVRIWNLGRRIMKLLTCEEKFLLVICLALCALAVYVGVAR